jgi:hypothetical protein
MAYFYPIHDREAGYVAWGGSQRRRTEVPFMQVVTTVAFSGDGPFKDVESLHRALAENNSR